MPWREVSAVSLRCEFVQFAVREGCCMRALCRRYGISPKTGYKWVHRYVQEGQTGLEDRSSRPRHSPTRTARSMERSVLTVRSAHPAWGGRKIRARLLHLDHSGVPSASTITEILRRHGRIDPETTAKRKAVQRFERDDPNALWQMDFKGHFRLKRGRCHPLTVLDDHSRFAIGLQACGNERGRTVQEHLRRMFERYGLPEQMLMDNGPPFGGPRFGEHTRLTAWLMRLGIGVAHGRPYHPQTQGKDERFHRTVDVEVIQRHRPDRMGRCQELFDRWRDVYNFERPHQALDMQVPGNRYRPSERSLPNRLEPIEYGPDDVVRKVQGKGEIYYRGCTYLVGKGLRDQPVALRPTSTDGQLDVFFCRQRVGRIDLSKPWKHGRNRTDITQKHSKRNKERERRLRRLRRSTRLDKKR